MSSGAYRVLGFAVWHGARWYLRRRLPSRGKLLGGGLLAGTSLAAAAILAARAVRRSP
jgi:hypothetical protein